MTDETPWRDYDTMYELYVEQQKSCYDIAEEMPVTARTINEWINRLGIRTRSISEGTVIAKRKRPNFKIQTYSEGYERIETDYRSERYIVHIHRLLAVAEYGFDAVANKHVHHKNGLRWDNRPDNIELLTAEEHSRLHFEERDDISNEIGLIAQYGAEAVLGPNEQYGSKKAAAEARQAGGGE